MGSPKYYDSTYCGFSAPPRWIRSLFQHRRFYQTQFPQPHFTMQEELHWNLEASHSLPSVARKNTRTLYGRLFAFVDPPRVAESRRYKNATLSMALISSSFFPLP